jgi:hypothetical protein
MIVFELGCSRGHRFEGWFASGEEYVRQRETGLVTCPYCEDGAIDRIPSARVNVGKSTAAVPAPAPVASPSPTAPAKAPTQGGEAVMGLPAELVAKLRQLVQSTENVGRRFPEEARKIHYEEAPPRAIRGQASAEEAQELSDEGIEFSPLPPFLTDSH